MASLLIGFLTALAVFGITLSILWTVGSDARSFKLASALIATTLAIGTGGFTVAWMARGDDLVLPTAFGFLFGGFSFGYILGLDLLVIAFASLSALVAGSGGHIYRSMSRSGQAPAGFDAS